MILTASTLTTAQSCSRRFNLEREWRPLKWRPKTLFDSLLRQSILKLSSGADKRTVTTDAVSRYLSIAASPGLDFYGNAYVLAHDFASMLQTVIEAVSRLTLLIVKPGPTVRLYPDLEWRCMAFQDESGALHSWVTMDKLTSDSLTRELHSWHVFGDIAAAQVPMTLHVIEIGRRSGNHQGSPWCRAYRHPAMPTVYRFQKTNGDALGDSWKPWWFSESTRNDATAWVDLMASDRLELIHHIAVKEPLQVHVDDFRQQLRCERLEPRDPFTILMDRSACDVPYICPFQPVCYGQNRDMESFGLYRKVIL